MNNSRTETLFMSLEVSHITADSVFGASPCTTDMYEKINSVSSRAERIMNSFVRWKKVLHPVLGNISDNTGTVLNTEGRVH